MPCVVAVNRFPNDTDEEVELVRTLSLEAGALDAQHNTAVVDGGEGAADLARAVVKAANAPSDFTLTYPDDAPIEDKIAAIATKVYGADGVEFLPEARRPSSSASTSCYGNLPICMAKTHLSISHDPSAQGAPTRLHGADPRPARLHRRGLRDGAVRHDRADAGPRQVAGGPEHRHRRRRAHGRAVLAAVARRGFPGAFGGRLTRARDARPRDT